MSSEILLSLVTNEPREVQLSSLSKLYLLTSMAGGLLQFSVLAATIYLVLPSLTANPNSLLVSSNIGIASFIDAEDLTMITMSSAWPKVGPTCRISCHLFVCLIFQLHGPMFYYKEDMPVRLLVEHPCVLRKVLRASTEF